MSTGVAISNLPPQGVLPQSGVYPIVVAGTTYKINIALLLQLLQLTVKTVNGTAPDADGNVNVAGGTVDTSNLVDRINAQQISGVKTFLDSIVLTGLAAALQNSKPLLLNTDGTLSTLDGLITSINGLAADPDTGNVTLPVPDAPDLSDLVDKTTDQTVAGAKTFTSDFTVKGAGQVNTIIGALINPGGIKYTVAPLLHLSALRLSTTLSAPTPVVPYQTAHDSGYFIHMVINAGANDGTQDFPSGSAFDTWQTQFDSYIDAMYAYGVRGALVAIENEPCNIVYHALSNNSANFYLAMLTHAATKCHSVGYEVTDGGNTGDWLKYSLMTWLNNNGRTSDYNAVLTGEFTTQKQANIQNGSFPTNNSLEINFIHSMNLGFAATGADDINYHWYCSTNGTQPASPLTSNILLCKEWLETVTGKPAIINELGQHNMLPAYPVAMLTALISAGMKYIFWYDGSGGADDGTNAQALNDTTTGALNSSGTAFAGYISSLSTIISDIFKIEGGKAKLPALASSVDKMAVIKPDGSVAAQDIPTDGGGGSSPANEDYFILKDSVTSTRYKWTLDNGQLNYNPI